MSRQIVAARVPYFVSALYRQRLNLRPDKPLLVAMTRTVSACCEQCAARGVLPKMLLRQAQTLAPDAILVRPDLILEKEAINVLLEQVAAKITPLVEYATGDHANCVYAAQSGVFYIDLEHLNDRQAVQLVSQMQCLLSSLLGNAIVHAGLSDSKFRAYAQTHDANASFAALPIDLLPLDSALSERLHLLGLTTVGAFAALPTDAVYRQLGKYGLFLYQLARGLDLRPVRPFKPQIVERVNYTSDYPIHERYAFDAVLDMLSNELSARLSKRGCMGRSIHVAMTDGNGRYRERRMTMQRELSDATFIRKALRLLVDKFSPFTGGVCEVVVTLTDIVPFAGFQLSLFDYQAERQARLIEAVEKLAARYGREAFTRPIQVDGYNRLIEHRFEFQPFLTV